MIATVMASTVAASTMSAGAGIAATLMLILLIVLRELAGSVGPRSRSLARMLIVAIAPLLVVFTATVIRHLAALV